MRRASSYNEHLSQRLHNPRYAQRFLLSIPEGPEALGLEEALRHTFEVMGIKECSALTGVPAPHLVDFIKGKRHLKPETLDTLLKPFGLRTKLVLEKAS